MEPGKTLNCDGKAAYSPEHTYGHSVASSFAAAMGFDGEGKLAAQDTPIAGPHPDFIAPEYRNGVR